jgi:hypothetical protein
MDKKSPFKTRQKPDLGVFYLIRSSPKLDSSCPRPAQNRQEDNHLLSTETPIVNLKGVRLQKTRKIGIFIISFPQ